MKPVSPAEILAHYLGSKFTREDNINLIALTPSHEPFPEEPINPRTKLKYGRDTMANARWRNIVRKMTDSGNNTSLLAMDKSGKIHRLEYPRDTINSLANNVIKHGEDLVITVKFTDLPVEIPNGFEDYRKHIRHLVADLLLAHRGEIELPELEGTGITELMSRKLKFVTVVPARPISLMYSHSPIPVRIKIKYL